MLTSLFRTRLINYYMEGAPANNDTSKEKVLIYKSKVDLVSNKHEPHLEGRTISQPYSGWGEGGGSLGPP